MHESPLDDYKLEWIRNRRSIRRYKEAPVPPNIIERLLQTAVWAPSAHNRQPWRFAVLQGSDLKHRLAKAMGDRLQADLERDGVPHAVIEADVELSYSRITSAPVLILLGLSMMDMDEYPDAGRNANERIMAIQSAAMAGQNLLLAAHGLGLGCCWMCAPLFCQDVVRNTLDLPDSWQPQGLITVGYPAEERHKERLPLSDRVRYLD